MRTTTQQNINHSLQMEVLEEMRQRRARNDNAPRWIRFYMLVLAVSLFIVLVHPYIIKLVDLSLYKIVDNSLRYQGIEYWNLDNL